MTVQPSTAVESIDAQWPTVVFDAKLGRQLSFIDFDIEQYAEQLQQSGLPEAQVADTTVTFKSTSVPFGLSNYDPHDKKLTLRVTPWRSELTLNRALGHETEHHVEKVTETAAPVIYTQVANSSLLAGFVSLATTTVMEGVSKATNSSELIHDSRIAAIVGLACIATGSAIYYLNPEERRAHRAGSRHNVPDQPLIQIER